MGHLGIIDGMDEIMTTYQMILYISTSCFSIEIYFAKIRRRGSICTRYQVNFADHPRAYRQRLQKVASTVICITKPTRQFTANPIRGLQFWKIDP